MLQKRGKENSSNDEGNTMTQMQKLVLLLEEFGVKYVVYSNKMVSIKGIYWVFDDDGDFDYLEDPDFFTREYPKLSNRKDITIH